MPNNLPAPPWRVYGYYHCGGTQRGPIWMELHGYLWITGDGHTVASWDVDLTDPPHPRNDPEAVAMIQKAKGE